MKDTRVETMNLLDIQKLARSAEANAGEAMTLRARGLGLDDFPDFAKREAQRTNYYAKCSRLAAREARLANSLGDTRAMQFFAAEAQRMSVAAVEALVRMRNVVNEYFAKKVEEGEAAGS